MTVLAKSEERKAIGEKRAFAVARNRNQQVS
jgi:hypothetical protein